MSEPEWSDDEIASCVCCGWDIHSYQTFCLECEVKGCTRKTPKCLEETLAQTGSEKGQV